MGSVGDCAVVPATGRVTLPVHVVWSAQGDLDLDDPVDRRYAYEIVLAEGTADGRRAYMDLGVQFGAWDDLRLVPHVRAQWGI